MFELFLATMIDALFAAVAGLGFAYASSPPAKTLAFSALIAAISHASRFLILQMQILNITVATLIASFLAGILGMFFAKRLKVPAEIIAFPALLPMVPGIYAYKSILALFSFIKSDDASEKTNLLIIFFDNALTTAGVAIAMGVGVSITLLLFYEQSLMITRGARCDIKTRKEVR
ncbi:threonine/serine exporter family protein [Campylobacter sp. RM13119]|nr:threonine/serine exporter family protein [Campylobacter sp. 7477a]MBE3605408.1 threonine/serine exporter family protein [Campylobacter sp. RM13119]MBE3609067.1 threonine/serine exporter family protein [Campylobacter sp. RM12916]